MSHLEMAELLGAHALDAVDGEEREALDGHLRNCRRCERELAEHRDVAGFLSPGWLRAPEELWDRIAGSLDESPPPLELVPVAPLRPRPGLARLGAALAAAAAVAVIGFLGVRVVDEGWRIDRMEAQAPAAKLEGTIRAAQADPSARNAELRSGDGSVVAEVVMLPDGTGYLLPADLPPLGWNRTYQLWAVVGPSRISVGVLGADPGLSAFKVAGNVSGLAITEEPAGGVVLTDHEPVGIGTPA